MSIEATQSLNVVIFCYSAKYR